MGLWEWLSSATESLKRKSRKVEPMTEAFRKGYDVGRAAAANLDGAVRIKASEIHHYMSDDQVREKYSRVVKDASKNGALYLARSYGAGPVIDVILQSLTQEKKVDLQKERIDELEIRVAKLEKVLKSKL